MEKLEFNAKKCHIMELGKSKRRPVWNYMMEQITKTKDEKDLVVNTGKSETRKRHK